MIATNQFISIQSYLTCSPDASTASHGQQDFAYTATTADQPFQNPLQHKNYPTGAHRSFPLSGGVAPRGSENTSSFTHQLDTASPAPLPHSERRDVQSLAEETREATYGDSRGERPITEQDRTGLLAGVRPFNKRTDTHPHVPGEFPDPTPTENQSQAFFGQDGVGSTSTTDAPPVHSDLRHTGTLDHPRPKSSDQPRHQSRDTTGLGAHGASQKHDTASPGPHNVSPYSSMTLDPRVYGKSAPPLEQQRFDPQTRVEPPAQHSLPIRKREESLAALAPSESTPEDPKHHYGHDAAAVGAGTAALSGLYQASQRHDAPDGQYATSKSSVSAPQEPSRAPDTYYGTSKAPAPLVDSTHTSTSAIPSSSVTPGSHIKDESPTHHGSDAVLGGAGLATAGRLHHASQRDEGVDTGPASKTIGPHSSNVANILDPRVQPDPAKQNSHNLLGPHQSDTSDRRDANVDDKAGRQDQHHHHGRDAAAVGGVGTAAYGAYEVAKAYGDHPSTQPEASMMDQRYDPTAAGAHASNPTPAYAEYHYNEPRSDTLGALTGDQHSTEIGGTHDTHNHTSRNTALGAGAGAAALSGAAFAGARHHDSTQKFPDSENPVPPVASSTAHVPVSTYQQWQPMQNQWPSSRTTTEPSTSSIHPTEDSNAYSTGAPTVDSALHPAHGTTLHDSSVLLTEQRHDNVENIDDGNHNKRDAAMLGTVGAAALAGAGHAHHHASQPAHDYPASSAYPAYDSSATSAHPTRGMASHASHVPIAPATQQHYDNVESLENRGHNNHNTALLGTAGVAALAGTEYAHHNANQPMYNSSATFDRPKNDPSAIPIHQTHDSSATPAYPTQGTTSHASQIPVAPATHQRHDATEDLEGRGHDKRNAALLGTAGAATALGAGHAYHNADRPMQDPTMYGSQVPATSAVHPATTTYTTQAPASNTNHQHYDTAKDSTQKDHDKHNTALLGTAGAATAVGAGYAYAHRQDQKNLLETQERLAKMEKQHEKEQARLEHDTYKQQEKDQHKLDKDRAKIQKPHPEQEEKEKKHNILGFLHRDKSKKEKSSPSAESTPRASRDYSQQGRRHSKDFSRESPRHSREYPDPRTTAGAYEDLPIDLSGRNKLHKDPPKGHPAREALEHPEVFASGGLGNKEYVGVDGSIEHPDLIYGNR